MPTPMSFIPADLLESLIRDIIRTPFRIYYDRRTLLSPSAVQQLVEQGQSIFGEEYSIIKGYRMPVRFKSEAVERVIFCQFFRCNYGGWLGWDVRPEEDVRERLQRDRWKIENIYLERLQIHQKSF